MTDKDIPIAYGTAIYNAAPNAPFIPMAPPDDSSSMPHDRQHDLRTATAVNGGRSSRVLLPRNGQENAAMSESTIQSLFEQGYTRGLAEALRKNKLAFPLSIWVIDNSGSMASRDGHRLVETPAQNKVKFVPCTRWAEMQQTVDYHVQMAAMLSSPTVFRLLNDPGRHVGPQQFSIAERGKDLIDEDLAIAQSTMINATPGGVTPLIAHLQEIRQNVLDLESSLRRDGTKVVVVLATDGLPTDERGISNASVKNQFVNTLRSLEGLPVWLVVRLCTDDNDVVEYYNSLDDQLELSIEVLDDFTSEAAEVYAHNKWLNYGLALHRMREMGFHSKLFDLMDERSLSVDELREFFRILFGDGNMDAVPDPQADWNGFSQAIERLVGNEQKTWNPVHKRMEPWIDMRTLRKQYGPGWFSFFGYGCVP